MWDLLSSDGFMPHGHCYLWKPALVGLHLVTDGLIALAYTSIPFSLLYLFRRRLDIPFRWMFLWFGLFIVSCGATHAMEAWNLYHADYWLAGLVKAFTAVASLTTAVLLVRAMPEALALPTPAALREASDALRLAHEDLERRVEERTRELSRVNAALGFQAQLLGSVQSIVLAFDAEGRITYWNRQAEASLGWTGDEVRERDALKVLGVAGSHEGRAEQIRDCLSLGTAWAGELAVRRKDGRALPTWVTQSPLRNEVRAITGAVWVVVDMTDRRRVEASLRESEERYRRLFESIPQPILLSDLGNLRILAVNEAAVEQYGYSREEFLALTLEDIEAGGGGQATPSHRRKDGSLFEADVHSMTLDVTGWRACLSVVTDVTTRNRMQNELEASRSLLERSQAVAHVGSWASGEAPDGKLVWSRETGRIFGLPADQFDGKVETFFSLVHPEDRENLTRRSDAAFRGETVYSLDHRIVRPDGSVRWVHEEADVVPDHKTGRPTMIGIVQDITERKLLEDQLQQSQKMEAVGRLAGGIAHDFNNLLGVIEGYAQLLLRRAGGEDQRQIGEIQKAAERATALTRKLLAFSRRQVLQVSVFNLNRILEDMEKLLVRLIGEDLRLTTRLDPELGSVRADTGQIEQVVINMAVNARDAMLQGGTLTLETHNVTLDATYAADHPSVAPGPYVMMSIEDSGLGMDAETRKHIFEPFFTTKERGKGTGLGLAMAYGIIKQSEGHIWVYSEPGLGTIFKVYLPRVDQAPLAPGEAVESEPVRGGTETILLVEDEDALRNLTREILEEEGYAVLEAASGHAALKVAEAFAGDIDLLVTDVVMPGMSGRALAQALSLARPATRVLYMSGYTADAIVHHGVLDEGLAFLQKPVSPDVLLRKLRELLDDSRSRS